MFTLSDNFFALHNIFKGQSNPFWPGAQNLVGRMEDQEADFKAPRAGRRARQAQLVQDEQVLESLPDEQQRSSLSARTPVTEHIPEMGQPSAATSVAEQESTPSRRAGFTDVGPPPDLLADSDSNKKFTGVSRRKQEQEEVQAQEHKAKVRSKYEDRALNEITDIPELEEEGKEDISRVVAAAPRVRANRIQGIEELDADSQYQLPPQQDRDIDLSILTSVLCSSDMVYEPDEVWNPELLLSQVAAELNAEKDHGALATVDSLPLGYQDTMVI